MFNYQQFSLITALWLIPWIGLPALCAEAYGRLHVNATQTPIDAAKQSLTQLTHSPEISLSQGSTVIQGSHIKSQTESELLLLLPLYQNQQHIWLTQVDVHRFPLTKFSYSCGLGKRWGAISEQSLWGTHLFYDYASQKKHYRLGLTAEWLHNDFQVTLNGYLPLHHWQTINQSLLQEKPASGFDVRLHWRCLKQPSIKLTTLFEHYRGQLLPTPLTRKTDSWTLGIHYTPVPLFTASYGAKIVTQEKITHQLQLQLVYYWGLSWKQQLDPTPSALLDKPEIRRLSPIQRRASMVLEQRILSLPAAVNLPVVPTPAVPTPAVPTPAVPTPAIPTPAVPTPAIPAPARTPARTPVRRNSLALEIQNPFSTLDFSRPENINDFSPTTRRLYEEQLADVERKISLMK